MTRKTHSLGYRIGMALAQTAVATSLGAIALTVSGMAETDVSVTPSGDSVYAQIMDDRPHAKGSAAALLEKHERECWRVGQEPKVAVPGHVIARTADEMAATYRSDLVGVALDQELSGADAGLAVTAFCV